MISIWPQTASADEVVSDGDLGISRRDALGLQSVADAAIPLPTRDEASYLENNANEGGAAPPNSRFREV